MALQRYNHTINQIVSGAVDVTDLKVMLLDNNAVFDPTHTSIDEVSNSGAYEVYGNGWTQGGEPFANAAFSIVDTSNSMFDMDNLAVTATGGNIGPANAALLFVNNIPLFFQAFDAPQEAGDGTPFLININANGLFRMVGS